MYVPTTGKHCPFLNRADARCGDAFSIEKLDHAFEHCFGRYTSCTVYMELLIERRVRRAAAAAAGGNEHHSDGLEHPLIQVSVNRQVNGRLAQPDPHAQHAAGSAGVPALPGV